MRAHSSRCWHFSTLATSNPTKSKTRIKTKINHFHRSYIFHSFRLSYLGCACVCVCPRCLYAVEMLAGSNPIPILVCLNISILCTANDMCVTCKRVQFICLHLLFCLSVSRRVCVAFTSYYIIVWPPFDARSVKICCATDWNVELRWKHTIATEAYQKSREEKTLKLS